MSSPRDEASLIQVAKLYYRENRSQAQIAGLLGTSRSNVSRMLTAAQERGIVEIRIHERVRRDLALERALVERFGLTAAVVASHVHEVGVRSVDLVGELAWTWLREQLTDGMTIAMSWGEGLQAVVAAVTPTVMSSTEVVQLVGGVSGRASFVTSQELVREFATRLGATYRYFHAPAGFATLEARRAMTAEPAIAEALTTARGADLALVGIGSVVAGSSAAILGAVDASARERQEFWASGPVGNVAGRYFDAAGAPVRGPVDDRVLGLTLAEIAAIPTVVGIAAGTDKADPIHGALAGRLVDVLVCDAQAAGAVLDRG
ncbi:MAG: helix-turn-helix domain-containing protein [Actinobacteria bacterium]|nr:helix-turn-helix domain-containing protein [Actinomycetota bacterium]